MKAKYVKPSIYFEKIEMTNSIAVSCSVPGGLAKQGDAQTCLFIDPDEPADLIFLESNQACTTKVESADGVTFTCYTTISDNYNPFNSY